MTTSSLRFSEVSSFTFGCILSLHDRSGKWLHKKMEASLKRDFGSLSAGTDRCPVSRNVVSKGRGVFEVVLVDVYLVFPGERRLGE